MADKAKVSPLDQVGLNQLEKLRMDPDETEGAMFMQGLRVGALHMYFELVDQSTTSPLSMGEIARRFGLPPELVDAPPCSKCVKIPGHNVSLTCNRRINHEARMHSYNNIIFWED